MFSLGTQQRLSLPDPTIMQRAAGKETRPAPPALARARLTALLWAPQLCLQLFPGPQAARNMGGYKTDREKTFTPLQELGI